MNRRELFKAALVSPVAAAVLPRLVAPTVPALEITTTDDGFFLTGSGADRPLGRFVRSRFDVLPDGRVFTTAETSDEYGRFFDQGMSNPHSVAGWR